MILFGAHLDIESRSISDFESELQLLTFCDVCGSQGVADLRAFF
jgi:hypothetical protein